MDCTSVYIHALAPLLQYNGTRPRSSGAGTSIALNHIDRASSNVQLPYRDTEASTRARRGGCIPKLNDMGSDECERLCLGLRKALVG